MILDKAIKVHSRFVEAVPYLVGEARGYCACEPGADENSLLLTHWGYDLSIPDETAVLEALKLVDAAKTRAMRAAAYVAEADPLFFKAQRGDATQQEWLDKIAEIKARYPVEA